MSPPCEQSDDGASLAPRDLDARRARSFSRYETFAFRYATCSASSCSRVGSGFGLSASGPVVAAPALQGRDARDPVPGHGLRLGQTVLDVVARRGDLRLPIVASAAASSLDLYSLIQFLAVYAGMASRLASASLPAPALMSASASRRNPSS